MANLILRTAGKLRNDYPDVWNGDFGKNKERVNELLDVESKVLRNKIAGAITRQVKQEKREEEQALV